MLSVMSFRILVISIFKQYIAYVILGVEVENKAPYPAVLPRDRLLQWYRCVMLLGSSPNKLTSQTTVNLVAV